MNKSSPEYLNLADQCMKQFAQTSEDALTSLLFEEDLNDFQKICTRRVRDFPGLKTLKLFMRQVASDDKSCNKTLIQESLCQAANDLPSLKTRNSAYCKARKRLPEESLKSLMQTSGQRLDDASPEAWKWHDRRVVITDGTTASMPDTEDNQKVWPQSGSQKKGIGFPIVRMLAFITLGSGALLNMVMAPCEGKGSGEQSLLLKMIPNLKKNDIVLGDAIFETYFLLCLLQLAGADGVFEKKWGTEHRFSQAV